MLLNMMKKYVGIILFLLALVMCLSAASAYGSENTITDQFGDFQYIILEDGTVEIKAYLGEAQVLLIPDTLDGIPVSSIGMDALCACRSLNDVTIAEGIVSIGHRAFANCSYMNSITIPDTVTEIGEDPFKDCSSLQKIDVAPGNPCCATRDGVLFSISGERLICCPAALPMEEYSIPEGTQTIDQFAFSQCKNLTRIEMPDSITSIGLGAFWNCRALADVKLSNNITRIEGRTFNSCWALNHVVIPNSVTSIGEAAFNYCKSLTEIYIPDNVTYIDNYAFSYCDMLTAVHIPDSIATVGYNPFAGCPMLTNIQVSQGHPYLILLNGVLFSKPDNRLICYSGSLTDENYSIPDGTRIIGAYAFCANQYLTSVTIPDSVTEIGTRAFYECTSMPSIVIPESVTSIDEDAFLGCEDLVILRGSGNTENPDNNSNEEIKDGSDQDTTALVSKPAVTSHENWQQAYYDFIINKGYKTSGQEFLCLTDPAFALHDLNDDGTPELLAFNGGDCHANGETFAYYAKDGAAQYAGRIGGDIYSDVLYYYEGSSYPGVFFGGGGGGYSTVDYRTIQDGQIVIENIREYGTDYINDKFVDFDKKITSDNELYQLACTEEGQQIIRFTEESAMDWESFIAPWVHTDEPVSVYVPNDGWNGILQIDDHLETDFVLYAGEPVQFAINTDGSTRSIEVRIGYTSPADLEDSYPEGMDPPIGILSDMALQDPANLSCFTYSFTPQSEGRYLFAFLPSGDSGEQAVYEMPGSYYCISRESAGVTVFLKDTEDYGLTRYPGLFITDESPVGVTWKMPMTVLGTYDDRIYYVSFEDDTDAERHGFIEKEITDTEKNQTKKYGFIFVQKEIANDIDFREAVFANSYAICDLFKSIGCNFPNGECEWLHYDTDYDLLNDYIASNTTTGRIGKINSVVDFNDEIYIYMLSHGSNNSDRLMGIEPDDFVNAFKTMEGKKVVIIYEGCFTGRLVTSAEKLNLDEDKYIIIPSTNNYIPSSAGSVFYDSDKRTAHIAHLVDACLPKDGKILADEDMDGQVTLKEYMICRYLRKQDPSSGSTWDVVKNLSLILQVYTPYGNLDTVLFSYESQ